MSSVFGPDTHGSSMEQIAELIAKRPLPPARDIIGDLQRRARGNARATAEAYARVVYETPTGPCSYDLLKIATSPLVSDRPLLLVRAGIHGDEVSGPLTILRHLEEILDYAGERGVDVVIYPLDNPSGFDARLRYNIENDRGSFEDGNNDFLRYRLSDGTITGDLLEGGDFERWYWSSDPELPSPNGSLRLPKETLALHAELERLPMDRVTALLDLHQDNFLTSESSGLMSPGAYHYAFGDVSRYHDIAREIGDHVPLIANAHIGSGFFGSASAVTADAESSAHPKSDSHGFIVRHDGTLPDLAVRHGALHAITAETTGATPPDAADAVNMIWIRRIIEMIAA